MHPTTTQPTTTATRLTATPRRQRVNGEAVILVRRAQAGDRDAFGQLYTRYTPVISRYVASRTRDRDAVADLVQDTFLAALENLHRADYDVHSWLVRLAATTCLRHARAHRRDLRATSAASERQRAAATAVADSEPARRLITAALAELRPRQRLAVQLRFLDGHPTQTTARIMGCSRDALRRVQRSALRQLHTRLTDPAGAVTIR